MSDDQKEDAFQKLGEMLEAIHERVADPNALGTKVNWQFTTADARIKLARLYPVNLY